MSNISAFDFSNEGDCVLANDNLKPHNALSNDIDQIALSTCYDIFGHDIEMTEQQIDSLKQYNEHQIPSIRPFIDVIDMNRADEDLVNSIKPTPAIVIGIKGEF